MDPQDTPSHVFSDLFALNKRIVDPLTKTFLEKASMVSPSTKSTVLDTLKELGEGYALIGSDLDALQAALSTVSITSPMTPEKETELLSLIEAITSTAMAHKQIPGKHQKLKQLREAVDATAKKVKKEEAAVSEKSKMAAQFQRLEESAVEKQQTNRQLEKDLAEAKKKLAALEKTASTERAKFDKEIIALRQQNEEQKENKKLVDSIKTDVVRLREKKEQLAGQITEKEAKLKALEEKRLDAEERAAAAKKTPTTLEPAVGSSVAAGVPSVSAPVGSLTSASASQSSATAPAGSSLAGAECAVCHFQADYGKLALLLNCLGGGMHYLCENCIINAYLQSLRYQIDFKYTVCPICHESVTLFESANMLGQVDFDAQNRPVVTFQKGGPSPSAIASAAAGGKS